MTSVRIISMYHSQSPPPSVKKQFLLSLSDPNGVISVICKKLVELEKTN